MSLDDILAQLRVEYISELPDKILDIEQQLSLRFGQICYCHNLGGIGIKSLSEFATIYITAPGPEETLITAGSWIVTTIARARNNDMVYFEGAVLRPGKGPIMMEPVHAEITLPAGRNQATVHILDHDGRRTGETLESENGKLDLNSARTKAVYYEVTFP